MAAQAQANDDVLSRRPLYIYDIPEEILHSLTPRAGGDEAPVAEETKKEPKTEEDARIGAQACSMCGVVFSFVQEQKVHARSDHHQYNLKLKIRGQKPVTEAEFEKLAENLDESLSGSDNSSSTDNEAENEQDAALASMLKRASITGVLEATDGEDEHRPKHNSPLIWLSAPELPSDTYYGVYRAMLTREEAAHVQGDGNIVDVLKKKQLAPTAAAAKAATKDGKPLPGPYGGPHIFMCMMGGGHFGAMVVALAPRKGASKGPMNKEATVIAHKTFHRYTTRRKQGGSQATNDNAKGKAKSAGADLRRYNEQALTEDVRGLLKEWKPLIDSSQLIFVRAKGNVNLRPLFGPYEGQVLRTDDPRLRTIPFTTGRATQNELMRCFIQLTRLQIHTISPEKVAAKTGKETAPTAPAPKPAKTKPSEEEETAALHTTQIQAFVRRSKIPALLSYLTNNSLSPDFLFQPADQNRHAPTALHLAATQSSPAVVQALLVRAGADPTIENGDGRTPFELSGDVATRDAFRAGRGELGEDKWDWEVSKIPAALTTDEMARRKELREQTKAKEEQVEQERLKAESDKLRSQPTDGKGSGRGVVKSQMEKRSAQEVREDEQRGMTPEMRTRLERERRARAAEARMRGGG